MLAKKSGKSKKKTEKIRTEFWGENNEVSKAYCVFVKVKLQILSRGQRGKRVLKATYATGLRDKTSSVLISRIDRSQWASV